MAAILSGSSSRVSGIDGLAPSLTSSAAAPPPPVGLCVMVLQETLDKMRERIEVNSAYNNELDAELPIQRR